MKPANLLFLEKRVTSYLYERVIQLQIQFLFEELTSKVAFLASVVPENVNIEGDSALQVVPQRQVE